MWQQAKTAVTRARSQAVAMSTRLLLKLAGPVPSLKKRAAPVRCLLNTARYPLKTRYRHTMAYNTERDSSTVKDPTSHTSTEAMLEYYAMYQSRLREYFCREYFCPPLMEAIREVFRSRKFCDIRYICTPVKIISCGLPNFSQICT